MTGVLSLDALFSPGSIALVGVPRGLKPGKVFLMGLVDQGFAGPIYPVHPNAVEVDGFKAYPRLGDIPGQVDMVIVMSPRETIWQALDECAQKQVKIVIVYTSGFSETGDVMGATDEERMQRIARAGGFRIVGPNCMGVYSPSSRLAPFPFMPKDAGTIAFLTQSGSLMNLFINMCSAKKLAFSRAVSFGNSCDVDFSELLEWTMNDMDTDIISSYCEGTRDVRRLFGALKRNAGKKPLIMWKVGQTDAGKRAAASHTGSLAGSPHLWRALFDQFGIVEVEDIEDLMDTVMGFVRIPRKGYGRMAVVSGPGGPAVSAADAVEKNSLMMAELEQATIKRLKDLLPETGTAKTNPVDVGLGASFDLRYYLDAVDILTKDQNVDAIVVLGGGVTDALNEEYVRGLIHIHGNSEKPVIPIAYPGFIREEKLFLPLHENNIPVYTTPDRALRAYAKIMRFKVFQQSMG